MTRFTSLPRLSSSNLSSNIELFAQPGIGEVVKAIAPNRRGRVRFRASFWPARLYSETSPHSSAQVPALPTEKVAVVGRDGITLLVMPMGSSAQLA
ncbi:MAG: NfeD family protein [Elainella sp. Prado103]|jgi:membrane protein implicated in regulation of membrane protease activity|nr:NfeD family protein [Elainella sp. Prado103]